MPASTIDNEVYVPHLGWLLHEPQDEVATLLRQGHFEAAEQAFFWLYLRDGDQFLDCGAHVGLYSILAGRAVGNNGQIVSVEPNPKTAAELRKNLSRNGMGGVKVLEAAAWSKVGHLNFLLEQSGRAAYCHVVAATAPNTVSVVATTLTEVSKEFPQHPCCLVKIDTEGAEIEVLQGAREAIKADAYPLLMVEFNEHNLRLNGDSTKKLFALLTDLGYQMHRFNPETLRLEPASFAGEIWYENLFAAMDPDGVNQRLADATEGRLRIAREITERRRACDKTQELQELDNYKQKSAEVEGVRRWAQQSDASLEKITKKHVELEAAHAELEATLHETASVLTLSKRLQRHWWVRFGKHAHILNRKYFSSRKIPIFKKRIPHEPASSVEEVQPPSVAPIPALSSDSPSMPFRMETTLDHLVKKGFQPKVIFDVGAAKGYWSELATHFFPNSEFYLVDPLKPNEPRLQELCAQYPNIHYFINAAGDQEGELVINVTPDLDGSSLLSFNRERQPEDHVVNVITLDSLLERGLAQPPQLVKMDVQGYELKALNGGQRLFETAEVFILEISLFEFMPGTPLFHEVVAYMAQRGYRVFDLAGFLRRPFDDDLGQVDLVFVRNHHPFVASNRWM